MFILKSFILCSTLTFIYAQETDTEKLFGDGVWTWTCEDNRCVKKLAAQGEKRVGPQVCKLTCGEGILWPHPTGKVSVGKDVLYVNENSIDIVFEPINKMQSFQKLASAVLTGMKKTFMDNVLNLVPQSKRNQRGDVELKEFQVTVYIDNPGVTFIKLNHNENYTLIIRKGEYGQLSSSIFADNIYGARNALETLSQLTVYDEFKKAVAVPSEVEIHDGPLYTYRGILLDTSRSYVSIPVIKRIIDGMAASKLNTFHWHIVDSQSFPFVSKSYPNLTKYGAYTPDKIYTPEEIGELIMYGLHRGVRIVPEMDAPAHVGEGWQWAGDATVCFNALPWSDFCVEPPCGQLNPTSDKMYDILKGIYDDMANLFVATDLFHMGGDEVNMNCWNSSKEVVDNLGKYNLSRSEEDFHVLWKIFQDKALDLLENSFSGTVKPVLWTSSLTEIGRVDKYLEKEKYIIQIWTKKDDRVIAELLNKGFQVIFSNYDALYLDCGFGAWVSSGNNWCSPYIPWQTVYENDPQKLAENLSVDPEAARSLILGEEATLWTEQADDEAVEQRLWPRSAAMAERLWGSASTWKEAESRFMNHRERLVQRGVHSNTIQPEWCIQNPGYCRI